MAWKWSWLIFSMLSYPPPRWLNVSTYTHTETDGDYNKRASYWQSRTARSKMHCLLAPKYLKKATHVWQKKSRDVTWFVCRTGRVQQ